MQLKTIEYEGVTRSVKEWSEILNIPAPTLHARIKRGWPVDKILTREVRKGQSLFDKNRAERALNEMTRAQLPKHLAKLVKNYHGNNFGWKIRRYFRKEFDAWFESGCAGASILKEKPAIQAIPKDPANPIVCSSPSAVCCVD